MFPPVMNVCSPLKTPHFPFSGTPLFRLIGIRVPASARALLFLLAGTLSVSGCAARRVTPSDRIPAGQPFWNGGCQETVPVNPDGFQHFVCADVHNGQWELLVRRQPK